MGSSHSRALGPGDETPPARERTLAVAVERASLANTFAAPGNCILIT